MTAARVRAFRCAGCNEDFPAKPYARKCDACRAQAAARYSERERERKELRQRAERERLAAEAGREFKRRVRRCDDKRTAEQKRADARRQSRLNEAEQRRLKAIAAGRLTAEEQARLKAERQARIAAKRQARAEAAAAERAKKPWLAPGLTPGQRVRIRRDNDRDYDLAWRLRDQLKRATPQFKARKVGARLRDALVARRPSQALHKRLGYTVAQLAAHIEALFTPGMTWEAFRSGAIHLDHRLPLKLFDTTTDAGIRAAWALDNLQPLWKAENEAKQGRVLYPLPPDLAPVLTEEATARLAARPPRRGNMEPACLTSGTAALG